MDEADILIGGPLTASLQYVLSHMKLRDVARRPQHVFAAATIPHNGKKSVRKWLQRYYPDAVEVTTPLLHHANPKLTQLIVQVGDEHGTLHPCILMLSSTSLTLTPPSQTPKIAPSSATGCSSRRCRGTSWRPGLSQARPRRWCLPRRL